MNSKEAFQLVSNKVRYTSRLYEDELKLIQQDLDRLEKLEKVIEILKDIFGIESVYMDKFDNHIDRVLDCYDTFYIIPTQEQYELLKEVLVNE